MIFQRVRLQSAKIQFAGTVYGKRKVQTFWVVISFRRCLVDQALQFNR